MLEAFVVVVAFVVDVTSPQVCVTILVTVTVLAGTVMTLPSPGIVTVVVSGSPGSVTVVGMVTVVLSGSTVRVMVLSSPGRVTVVGMVTVVLSGTTVTVLTDGHEVGVGVGPGVEFTRQLQAEVTAL